MDAYSMQSWSRLSLHGVFLLLLTEASSRLHRAHLVDETKQVHNHLSQKKRTRLFSLHARP